MRALKERDFLQYAPVLHARQVQPEPAPEPELPPPEVCAMGTWNEPYLAEQVETSVAGTAVPGLPPARSGHQVHRLDAPRHLLRHARLPLQRLQRAAVLEAVARADGRRLGGHGPRRKHRALGRRLRLRGHRVRADGVVSVGLGPTGAVQGNLVRCGGPFPGGGKIFAVSGDRRQPGERARGDAAVRGRELRGKIQIRVITDWSW